MEAAPRAEPLRERHERRRRGMEQAAPVERVGSEKDDGGRRPIGKPACEGKLVQRAVARRLAALSEPDWSDGS
jgi:hypothetical protein